MSFFFNPQSELDPQSEQSPRLSVVPLCSAHAMNDGAELARSPAEAMLRVLSAELSPPRVFVHMSAIAGLSGCLSTNILVLRSLSVLSSACALCFNLWNRLLSAALWNLTFMSINLSRIGQLLLAAAPGLHLSPEQQQLFELAFARYGVKLSTFMRLLEDADAEWLEFTPNEWIVRAGDPMPSLWYLVHGEVESRSHVDGPPGTTFRPGKGGWLGELWDPNEAADYWEKPHTWLTGFRAKDHSRVVAFNRKKLWHGRGIERSAKWSCCSSPPGRYFLEASSSD